VAILSAGVVAPIYAQWTWNPAPLNAINMDVQRQGIMAQVANHSNKVARERGPGHSDTVSVAPTNGVSPEKLRYKPSSIRRKANYAGFVAQSRRADPAGADALAATLATDPIARLEPLLARYGLTTSNVADAYAVYWEEAWEAVHGVDGPDTREAAQAIKRQAAEAILTTPEFARATDAQKQELADSLLVQAVLIGAAKHQAGGDRGKLRQIADAVRQGAKGMGLDLDAMTLTEAGFVPAKKTGAADPAPGAPREALAATGDETPGYGLLAAGGGAGLGAAFLIGKGMGRRE
jgi:hypothetical protein